MGKIVAYTPEVATNEYDGVVKELLEAGDSAAYELDPVPADAVEKHRRRFGEAANRAGKSPYPVSAVETTEGVVLTYALVPKRGRKGATVVGAAPEA